MSRLKIIGLFTVFALLITVGSILILDDLIQRSITDARNSVVRSGNGAFAATAMAQGRLQDVTDEAQHSEIPAFLKTLQEHQDKLTRIQQEVSTQVPNTQEHKKRKKIIKEGHQAFVAQFVRDLIKNLTASQGIQYWRRRDQSTFKKTWSEGLIDCAARSVDKCMYDMTYGPLEQFWDRYHQTKSGPMHKIDLAIIVDHRGTGRANTADSKWSAVGAFADQTDIVKRALEQEKGTSGIFDRTRAQKSYFARAVPLYHQGNLVGSILVGFELDQSFAMEIKNATQTEVMILRGAEGHPVLHSSNKLRAHLGDDVLIEARSAISQGVSTCSNNADFACQVVPILGGTGRETVQLVLWKDMSFAYKVPDRAKNIIIFTMLMMFLLGLLVAVVMTRNTELSFVSIDQGVHEIIAGDSDYVFTFDPEKDSVANSMAQSLNVMMALLQGKPLPEEENTENPWADSLLVESDVRSQGRSRMELSAEPADAYYKRIYEEYRAGRLALGLDVSNLSYVSFVERIARIERRLKARADGKNVRFNVGVEEHQVILVPVFLS